MIWLFQAALAAVPADEPLRADVVLPPAGSARISLGGDLVGTEPDALAGTLLLIDATGAAVPYAVLRSDTSEEIAEGSLDYRPVGPETWVTDVADMPVDQLVLPFDDLANDGPFFVTVSWPGGRTAAILYEIDTELRSSEVRVPHVRGPFEIHAERWGADRPHLYSISMRTLPETHVPPVSETLPVSAPVLTEEGRARYSVALPGPRRVQALGLEVKDGLFDRSVSVGRPSENGDPEFVGSGRIRRVHVGDTSVDWLRVSGFTVSDDTLVFDVDTDRGRMLDIPSVAVESVGVELVVRDAGAGPHVLYAGSREPAQAYDLDTAVHALLRLGPPRVAAGPAIRNPDYTPLATRAGIDAPGAPLSLTRYRFARPLTAAPGWARFELDRDVLAHAKSDLGDLRVVDVAGAQVPFLLRRTAREEPWSEVGGIEREEKGAVSFLRVRLPDGDVPVQTVRIETGFDLFTRTVSILRDRGSMTETLRTVTWSAPNQGGTLSLRVGHPLGDALMVRIDNGDNPPLPVSAISVTTPVWEVRTNVPAGGARLVYGDPRQERPTYDLSLMYGEMFRTPLPRVTLGPEEALGTPEMAAGDRVLVLVGVGVLALGLIGMLIRVLRKVEEPASDIGSA